MIVVMVIKWWLWKLNHPMCNRTIMLMIIRLRYSAPFSHLKYVSTMAWVRCCQRVNVWLCPIDLMKLLVFKHILCILNLWPSNFRSVLRYVDRLKIQWCYRRFLPCGWLVLYLNDIDTVPSVSVLWPSNINLAIFNFKRPLFLGILLIILNLILHWIPKSLGDSVLRLMIRIICQLSLKL